MAYVTVPKDLTHVKSKVLFGLTKRQLVCFGGALLTGGPLYFLTRDYLSNSAAALLMIFAMLPGLLFALFERHGQPLEVVIQQMIQCCFIGHLVSFAEADQYDEKYCKWRYDDLPILPQPWQFIVPDEKKQQFEIVRALLNRPDVDSVTAATDAG